MNKDIKKEWINRLRDGKREQGVSYLNAGGKYCCLGVLCEMAAEAGVVTDETVTRVLDGKPLEAHQYGDSIRMMLSALPEKVTKWAELPDEFGGLGYRSDDMSLADLNDAGMSFPDIADIIEKEF